MIRFSTYSQFHGKYEPVGSDFLRVHQLLKYWPEAGLYKYGEQPNALIFTKVFVTQDWQFPRHYQGIKILDICDPMWYEDFNVVEMAQLCNAVTVPTENMAKFISQFHSKVVIVPDRFDLEALPEPKVHKGKAKTVVWFGYSHNAELLKPAIATIERLNLDLLIIANDDPLAYLHRRELYKFKKYKEDAIYEDLQQADFAILPEGFRPQDKFKSNNKTIKANLAGLPVARTIEEVELYMNAKERRKWQQSNYAKIREEYDVRKSVKQYKELIDEIKNN